MSQTLEELKVSIVTPTQSVEINGRTYTLDQTKARWSQMLDWSAELTSGMVLRSWKDESGDDISEITLTKEYASKKNKVTTEMIRTLFSLDVAVDEVPVDIMFDLVDIINESGFLERLERLSRGSSSTKKNTTK
jgi:hypothetical protein